MSPPSKSCLFWLTTQLSHFRFALPMPPRSLFSELQVGPRERPPYLLGPTGGTYLGWGGCPLFIVLWGIPYPHQIVEVAFYIR